MDEAWVIRLNVERYRRMLQAEVDEVARQTIQKMLDEFEAKLSSTFLDIPLVQSSGLSQPIGPLGLSTTTSD